jgi:hypothetical protein
MRRFGLRYRDLPKFVLRRLDRVAGEVNTVLIVVAFGLAMLNLLYIAKKFVDAPAPVAQIGAKMP